MSDIPLMYFINFHDYMQKKWIHEDYMQSLAKNCKTLMPSRPTYNYYYDTPLVKNVRSDLKLIQLPKAPDTFGTLAAQ